MKRQVIDSIFLSHSSVCITPVIVCEIVVIEVSKVAGCCCFWRPMVYGPGLLGVFFMQKVETDLLMLASHRLRFAHLERVALVDFIEA